MEKQELIAGLKGIMPIMDRLDQYNQKLDGIRQRIDLLQSQISAPYKIGFFRDHMGWLFGVMGGYGVGTSIAKPLLKITNESGISMIVSLIIIIAFIVVGVRINLKIAKKIFEQKKEPYRQELVRRQQEYEQAEQEMIAELSPHWQKVQELVPQDYLSPMFVRTVYGYLVNGRTDSMKEAVNLFEEEQHRWRMEQNQQQMYEQYQAEIRSLKEVTRELEQRVNAAEADAMAARAYAAGGGY